MTEYAKVIPLHKKRKFTGLIQEFLTSEENYQNLEFYLRRMAKIYPEDTQTLQIHLKKMDSLYEPNSPEAFKSLTGFIEQTIKDEYALNEKKYHILQDKAHTFYEKQRPLEQAQKQIERIKQYISAQNARTTDTLYLQPPDTEENYLYEAEKNVGTAIFLIRVANTRPYVILVHMYSTFKDEVFYLNLPMRTTRFPLPTTLSEKKALRKAQTFFHLVSESTFVPTNYDAFFKKMMNEEIPQELLPQLDKPIIYQGHYCSSHCSRMPIGSSTGYYEEWTHHNHVYNVITNPLRMYYKYWLYWSEPGRDGILPKEENTQTFEPGISPREVILKAKQALRQHDSGSRFPTILNGMERDG